MKILVERSQPKHSRRAVPGVLFLALLFGAFAVAFSQNPVPSEKQSASDPVSGRYEGVAKSGIAETRLTLEITSDQGKFSGRLLAPQGDLAITEGTFANGKLTLKLGTDNTHTLTAQFQDDKLTGEWTANGQTRAVELKKVPTIADQAALVVASTAPAVSLTGDWDGVADTQGQDLLFVLTLKVEGEKVTGESNSSIGSAPISNGTFKDGKLAFQLDSAGGPIYMTAMLKDGGLIGEYDYAGQSQGRWVAKKRNP